MKSPLVCAAHELGARYKDVYSRSGRTCVGGLAVTGPSRPTLKNRLSASARRYSNCHQRDGCYDHDQDTVVMIIKGCPYMMNVYGCMCEREAETERDREKRAERAPGGTPTVISTLISRSPRTPGDLVRH
jgi:hypothetical protein